MSKLFEMSYLESKELPWLKENVIFVVPTGSRAYGTHTEESDYDYKAVVIPPMEYLLGLHTFNEKNNSTNKETKNTKDDVDVSILSLEKFIKGLIEGQPPYLEMLFTKEEDIIYKNEFIQPFLDNRELFLAKSFYNKFVGFAKSQVKTIENNVESNNPDVYDYNYKQGAHAVRLLLILENALNNKKFRTKLKEEEIEIIRSIRSGEFSSQEFLEKFNDSLDIVGDELKTSTLPNKVDYERIERMLIDVHETFILERKVD